MREKGNRVWGWERKFPVLQRRSEEGGVGKRRVYLGTCSRCHSIEPDTMLENAKLCKLVGGEGEKEGAGTTRRRENTPKVIGTIVGGQRNVRGIRLVNWRR